VKIIKGEEVDEGFIMEPPGCDSSVPSEHRAESRDTTGLSLCCQLQFLQAFLNTSNFQEIYNIGISASRQIQDIGHFT
jgi:hypothetical protein